MGYFQDESSFVEWKRGIPRYDQILKTIIGFCNQNGGKIVVHPTNCYISHSAFYDCLKSY